MKKTEVVKSRYDHDIVVLGGGSVGIAAALMASGIGLDVLLVDKLRIATDSLKMGRVPSKALISASKMAHTVRTASSVGLTSTEPVVDNGAAVMEHVRATIDRVRESDAADLRLREADVAIHLGNMKFIDSHTVDIDGYTISSDYFIVATGSLPNVLKIDGIPNDEILTGKTLFDLPHIPDTLLVVGGGPVGCEMAQAFQRLGSKVTLVQRADRLLPREDPDHAAMLAETLRSEGVTIHLNATVGAGRVEGGKYVVDVVLPGETLTLTVDKVFGAIGRRPNLDGLALGKAWVNTDKNGIVVNDFLQTSSPNIFACGDVIGSMSVPNQPEHEAKTVVRNIVFPGQSKCGRSASPWATFTDPQVVHVGYTQETATAEGIKFDVITHQNGYLSGDLTTRSQMKVLVAQGTNKIVGVQMIGPRASEYAGEWVSAIEAGVRARDVSAMSRSYPTLAAACKEVSNKWYEVDTAQPDAKAAVTAYVETVRPIEKMLVAASIGGAVAAAVKCYRWVSGKTPPSEPSENLDGK
jgi:pyruvate/2-oxoglutarate dehydrogenase complex dihydrolipoamide dehydrogenase (E3) component